MKRLILLGWVARGEGRLLLTSSIAATMPGTYSAVYNASKSWQGAAGVKTKRYEKMAEPQDAASS